MATLGETPEARRERLGKTAQVSAVYAALAGNEDFVKWKTVEIDLKLERMRQALLTYDRSRPTWKEDVAGLLIAYQETKQAFDDCFKAWEDKGTKALAQLKGLERK